MSMPGSDLSQPASSTEPSSRSANITVSTESAMTSRETREARMPSWPIEMPSETEIVPNSIGKPPACRTPSLAALASRSSDRLQGVISFQEDATPICGRVMSSSVMPTARSIARAGARESPSVTSVLRGLRVVTEVSLVGPGTRRVRGRRAGVAGGPGRGRHGSRGAPTVRRRGPVPRRSRPWRARAAARRRPGAPVAPVVAPGRPRLPERRGARRGRGAAP